MNTVCFDAFALGNHEFDGGDQGLVTFLDHLAAQTVIDQLQADGIEHIVLLTHQGYENDKAMAAQLSGVDVIIGGDSHSLLGDFERVGFSASGPYPTVTANRDGDTVCIGQAWEYSKVFGLMTVNFEADGTVASCEGQASLVIGDSFSRNQDGTDVALDDTETADLLALLEDAVNNHLEQNGSDGGHPYAAGLRWDLDMSQPKGSRFSNLEVHTQPGGCGAVTAAR